MTFFSPLFSSQYLGLGLGLGLHFWGRGQGFAAPWDISTVSRVLGLYFTPSGCSLHGADSWHLAQVCRAGAQPHPAPRTGNSSGYLRNALCPNQGVQEPPSLSLQITSSVLRQLSKGWNKSWRIWLSCHLLPMINEKSQGTAINYNVGASYLL